MTGAKLLAGIFENSDTSSELIEQFFDIESGGVDWDVYDFGVTRIEVVIKAKGQYDAYDRFKSHQGKRIALYTSSLYRVASAKIYAVKWLPGDRVQYIAYGPNWDCERSFIVKMFDSTDTISDTISYISGKIPVANDNTDNIVTNSTTLSGWNPSFPQGSYPSDAIRELIAMSDSSSRLYDFRLIDEPMKAGSIRQYTPYYTYRDSSASADWVVKQKDLSGLSLSRDIENFANIVRVWYGLIEGTSTSVASTTMTDSGASFISDGVSPGDTITNLTKGGRTRVVSVDSETQITHEGWRAKYRGKATGGSTTSLTDSEADFINDGVVTGDTLVNIVDNQLVDTDGIGTLTAIAATTLTIGGAMSGGKSNDADERYEIYGPMVSGDDYSISTEAQTKYAEAQIDAGDLWDKEISVFERNMNETQAKQYATALLSVNEVVLPPVAFPRYLARHPSCVI
jgi:hypothetical protein